MQDTLWRHRKTGHTYRVVLVALNEADLTPVVIYERVEPGERSTPWVRPVTEFLDGRFIPDVAWNLEG